MAGLACQPYGRHAQTPDRYGAHGAGLLRNPLWHSGLHYPWPGNAIE